MLPTMLKYAEKRVREDTMQPAAPKRAFIQSAAANTDYVVVSTAASPAFLHAARCAYTRAPASTHVAGAGVRTRAISSCGCAVCTCGKDIQSVGRVAPRENEGRLAQASDADEREQERKGKYVHVCQYKTYGERERDAGVGERTRDTPSRREPFKTWRGKRESARSLLQLVLVVAIEVVLATVVVK